MPRRQTNQRWKEYKQREKREKAEERAKAYASRSVKEQLELIAKRPGNSAKEKAKLEAKLNASV